MTYQPTTGWVTDFADPDGDGEQVDYCLTLDAGDASDEVARRGQYPEGCDVLIGQKRIEDGSMVSDKWLVSMKAETFDKLIELWRGLK